MNKERAIKLFELELEKAEIKHPDWPDDAIYAASILNEEAGELTQAVNDFAFSGTDKEQMKLEAAQVGAMALRFLINLKRY